jgi:hypothetical protein
MAYAWLVTDTPAAKAEVVPITRIPRRQRAIQLAGMDESVRRLIGECRRPGCPDCLDGIESVRGQRLILCECSFIPYTQTVEFLKEEQRRRKAGLPLRQGKMENGVLTINEQPVEMPPGRVTL